MDRNARAALLGAVSVGAIAAYSSAAFAAEDENGFVIVKTSEILWQPSERGPDIAVVYGDPQKEGFYIIRARFKPGVMSAPHYHPNDRHVTVISGTWWAGTGASGDRDKTVPLTPGTYMMHPGGEAHYDGAKDVEAIVEIKGIGPAPSIPAGQ
jgi:quercetin dioxygenase-like cupin family protein